MGKSEHGPDMRDCAIYAREIEKSRGSYVTLLITLDGFGSAPGWQVDVLSSDKTAWLTGQGPCQAVNVKFPSRKHKTIEGAIFCALAELDASYAQEDFCRTIGLA